MRESLGRAMNAEDLSPKEYECAVDRLGALAFGNSMGSSILWVLLTGEGGKARELVNNLARRLEGFTGVKESCLPIARLAIIEYLFPNCRACNGASQQKNPNGVLIDCVYCAGTGLHRYHDNERSGICGLAWRPRLDRLMVFAHRLFSAAEIDAINEIRRQLEKDISHF